MRKGPSFNGLTLALFTPFKKGKVDEPALQRMVEWQVGQGTNGLLVLGTTGEAPTMTDEEHTSVIKLVVEAAAGKIPVMAGAGTNSTDKTIHYTRNAKKAGADAVLIVSPYYNKPSQEGLYQHFKAVNDAVDVPIYVYNNPGRCVVDIAVDTLIRLAKLPNIVGLKDSSTDLRRPVLLVTALGSDFSLLSGDEPTGLSWMAAGGHGVMTAAGNVIPKMMGDMLRAWDAGEIKKAQELHRRAMPVISAMYCDTNPIPAKYAASLLGFCSPEVRLPLVELSEANQAIVRKAMRTCGLAVAEAAE